jgi:CRISPR-associated protein Csc1
LYTGETFKSTEYLSERSLTVVVPSGAKGDLGRFKKTDPKRMGSDSPVGISKVRRYIGLAPGSSFTFSVWSKESLPNDLLITLGIRRSGEVRLRKTERAKKVCLNLFMLREVYGISEKRIGENNISLMDVYNHASTLIRGSDYRNHHFIDVDPQFVEQSLLPQIMHDAE